MIDSCLINYAHRGASQYAPENTLSSFYLGLAMGANGVETDIHRTRDGVLVLFHDDTLARVTGAPGRVEDYTWEELSRLRVSTADGRLKDKIVRFDEFLDHFSDRDIRFAIELKQDGVEKETIDLLNRYRMLGKTVLTSFRFESLARARAYDARYPIGYLVREASEAEVQALLEIGGEEICPKAAVVTKEKVEKWHAMGLNVRAWGVADTALMAAVYEAGVNGMTVNFPDRLQDLLRKKER